MSFISVVMPTMRVGGLDLVCEGLSKQTFKDFELVIVDGIYKHRKDIVKEMSLKYNFKIKHVEPFKNPFPNNAFCRYANSGLASADCQVVVFITDFTYLHENNLKKHAQFHMLNKNMGFMGPHQYYVLKGVSKEFEFYNEQPKEHDGAKLYHHSNEDTEKYVKDIESGKYNNLMWSLFDKPFDLKEYDFELDPLQANSDLKLNKTEGEIELTLFHAKNESCSLESLLKINGWNEILDGGHGYQDVDLADRLIKFGGVERWVVDPKNIVSIFNPRSIFPHGYRTRSVEDNRMVWMEQCSKNYPAKNSYKLREVNYLLKSKDAIETQLKSIEF